MKIVNLSQIKAVMDRHSIQEVIASQKRAFIDFSDKCITVLPPIQMHFPKFHGECHIKAGFKENDDIFIVKTATGFYKNVIEGLAPGDGVILVFSQKTGLLQAILCDGGYLTTLRTAVAAAIAAGITPWEIKNINIVGTGRLAVLIIEIMQILYPHAHFYLWGRDLNKAKAMASSYHNVLMSDSIEKILNNAGIIITTTASTQPIIPAENIKGRTHIIALGSDDIDKQECDPRLFQMADECIVDSKEQAVLFGECFYAIKDGFVSMEKMKELGHVLQNPLSPQSECIITDLTGIAAQDIAIAEFIMKNSTIQD